MLNSGVTSRITIRTFQFHVRQLSVQHTVNKSSSAYHKTNFHNRNEKRTCFPISKSLLQRGSNQSPLFTSSKRYISGIPNELLQIKSFEQFHTPKAPLAVEDVTESATTLVGLLQNAHETFFTHHVVQSLLDLSQMTGLPWWANIVATTFIFRSCVTLPFAIHQMRLLAKLEKVDIELRNSEKEVRKEIIKAKIQMGWPDSIAEEKFGNAMRRQWLDLLEKSHSHPMKSLFLMSLQTSLWITISAATWILCTPELIGTQVYTEMLTGGFGWITNLTEPDQIGLPIALGVVNLLLIEIHQNFRVIRRTKSEQWKVLFFRLISIGLIPAAANVPSAVSLYWLSSSLYGVLQALVLNSAKARRAFYVPLVDPELKNPYRFFWTNVKSKFRKPKEEKALRVK